MVEVFFLLGLSDPELMIDVAAESRRTNDLIVADFADTYWNLTLKTVMGLHWLTVTCPRRYTAALFIDDDIWVERKSVVGWKYFITGMNRKNMVFWVF